MRRELQLVFVDIADLIVVVEVEIFAFDEVDSIHAHIGPIGKIDLSGVNHAPLAGTHIEDPRVSIQTVKKRYTRM
jgi:hypothetical protein